MVVTIKRRIIRRGGVSPPALETQRFTAKSVDLWLLYLSGGEPPPLRTASLIRLSPSINSYLSASFLMRRSAFDLRSHQSGSDISVSRLLDYKNKKLPLRSENGSSPTGSFCYTNYLSFRIPRKRNASWERSKRFMFAKQMLHAFPFGKALRLIGNADHRLPTVLGNRRVSLMLATPVTYIIARSKPRPNPL